MITFLVPNILDFVMVFGDHMFSVRAESWDLLKDFPRSHRLESRY